MESISSFTSTLRKKDEQARSVKVIAKGSVLFGSEDRKRTEGCEARYDELLRQDKLLLRLGEREAGVSI